MKRFFNIVIVLLISFTMVGCKQNVEQLDYIDFREHLVSSYDEIEGITDTRYIAYYYGSSCGHCQDIKQDILSFFKDFTELPFYMIDTDTATGMSSLEEYQAKPSVFLISNGVVVDYYLGTFQIEDFIENYSNFDEYELEYTHFRNQHLYTYDDILSIEQDVYLVYYYFESCPHCMRAKPDFLKWAFTRGIDEIYFVNGASVSDPDNIPTELLILNSGTPILFVMSNGKFANEYYSGTEAVLNYILELGDGEITAEHYTE